MSNKLKDSKYCILPFDTLNKIGELGLNKHKAENPDSISYNDTMEALGLQQHIEKPMHRLGNTLDLIYMESLDRVRIIHSFRGNFISNHRIVGIEIRKQLEKHQSTKHRNYRDFSMNNFSQVFNNKILDQSSLEEAVQAFNEEMEKTLGKIIPKEAWYSLEQYIDLKEDKLSSTTVDFIRSEGNLETKCLYWFSKPKMC